MSFNFMAAITICSDFRAYKIYIGPKGINFTTWYLNEFEKFPYFSTIWGCCEAKNDILSDYLFIYQLHAHFCSGGFLIQEYHCIYYYSLPY